MSGLNNYVNSMNTFGSNVDGINDFLSAYQQNAIDDFNDQVAKIKEQGKALVETGGAIEGQYAAGKAVLASYRAYKAKYGKKKKPDDDDDGDDDDEGDENAGGEGGETGGQGEANEDATGGADETPVDGSSADAADAGADAADVGADAEPLGGLPVGAGGAADGTSSMGIAGTDAAGDTSALGPSDNPLTADQASQFTSAPEEPINDPLGANAPEAPEPPPAAGENSSGVSAAAEDAADEGEDLSSQAAQALGGNVSASGTGGSVALEGGTEAATDATATLGDVGAAATTDAVTAATTTAVTATTEAASGGLLAAAGVAAEAVPVLGGLAALGIGLYELFHHHSKPAPKPTPQNIIGSKGEMVVPSFDSVTDTPAANAAF